jgi:integrase
MRQRKLISLQRRKFIYWAERIKERSKLRSKATQDQVEYSLKGYIIPFFKRTLITKVDEHKILSFTRWVQDRGAKAWTHLKQLKKILRLAHRQGAIKILPEIDFEEFPIREGHYLSRSELARLMHHASRDLRLQIFLAARHAFRKKEVFYLHEDWVNWEHSVLLIPSSRNKNKKRRRIVPLSKTAIRILMARRRHGKLKGYLFPSPSKQAAVGSNRTAWSRALERAGLPKTFRFHDLRKTFASNGIMAGFPIELLARIGGFSPKTIREHYYIVGDEEGKRLVNSRGRK